MSNGNGIERLWKLQTQVSKLVLDGRREASVVSDALQKILSDAPEKFRKIAELGIIEVPAGYKIATYFETFSIKYMGQLGYFDPNVTDENFSGTLAFFKVGDRFSVDVYEQVERGTVSILEKINFLKSQDSVFCGAHGLGLAFEYLRDKLPNNETCTSLVESRNSIEKIRYLCVSKEKGANPGLSFGSYEIATTDALSRISLLSFKHISS